MIEATPTPRRAYRLAPLALVVVLASACGDNDKTAAKPPKTAPGATAPRIGTKPPASTVPSGSSKKSSTKGTLVAGKQNLLPLLNSSLRPFAPTQVVGKSLRVVALAGPASFWAGRNGRQRILVSMRLKGTNSPKITVGEKVDFVGQLTVSPASAGALGVRRSSDTTLLSKQGAYVDASAADVHLG